VVAITAAAFCLPHHICRSIARLLRLAGDVFDAPLPPSEIQTMMIVARLDPTLCRTASSSVTATLRYERHERIEPDFDLDPSYEARSTENLYQQFPFFKVMPPGVWRWMFHQWPRVAEIG
jgi:hypothetical protein